MEWTVIIQGIGAALAGGAVGAFLTYKLGVRKQKSSEFEILLNERKQITKDLTERIEKLEVQIEAFREREAASKQEIQNLRHQLLMFESSHTDIPLPIWMKDTEGKMIFLNDHYEDMFLLPRGYTIHDYIGKNDYAVWSPEIAKAFISNDKQVIRTKKFVRKIEAIEDATGKIYYADLLKYPRKLQNKVIGISGIILRTAETKEELE